jgi:hypothetical protein
MSKGAAGEGAAVLWVLQGVGAEVCDVKREWRLEGAYRKVRIVGPEYLVSRRPPLGAAKLAG